MFTVKFQIKILSFFFVASLLFLSCQKDDINSDLQISQEEISVQDGKIKFTNAQQFSEFMGKSVGTDLSNDYFPKIQRFEKSGFISLVPLYDADDEENVNNYYLKRASNLKSGDIDDIPLDSLEYEDEFICDPYFSALLNEKRELQIADMVYKYTQYGVFYTLYDNLESLYALINSKDSIFFAGLQPEEELEISEGIYFFRFDYADSYSLDEVCIDCEEQKSAKLKSTTDSKPNPYDLKICSSLRKTWLTKVVGPSAHCYENFTSKARIHVKVWNQNYGIYSSLGISVGNQYKRLGIWWTNKTEELELGYAFASFKYPGVSMNWPQNNSIWVKYDGYKMDQYGNMVSTEKHPSSFFSTFPIADKDKTILEIYVWNPFGDDVVKLSGSDVNSTVKDLTKQAGKAVWNYLKKELGTQPTVIVSSRPNNDIEFTYANWKKHKTNENKITEVFDWNTGQIGFKYNIGGGGGWSDASIDPSKLMTAKSYKEARILAYGMGRRGSTWKGAQVDFKDTK
jgi:hypothetical protein